MQASAPSETTISPSRSSIRGLATSAHSADQGKVVIDADNVAAGPVGDRFEEIAPGAVYLGKGDEGSPQVVPLTVA